MSKPNPLSVTCPTCHAVAGYQCFSMAKRSASLAAKRKKTCHPERTRAVHVHPKFGLFPVKPSKGRVAACKRRAKLATKGNCVNCHHAESFHTAGARGLGCTYAGCECSRFRQRLNIV